MDRIREVIEGYAIKYVVLQKRPDMNTKEMAVHHLDQAEQEIRRIVIEELKGVLGEPRTIFHRLIGEELIAKLNKILGE